MEIMIEFESPDPLLSRLDFRNGVFERDEWKCVFCGKPAQDAHHIIERRLWPDGGYYLNNGISVCGECHLKCESTELSVEEAREAAGITRKIVPPHMYSDHMYDKWGNPILGNGTRLKGELYYDESVQRVIDSSVVFVSYVKYPRTYHLPWSEGMHDDDRMIESVDQFLGREVVVSEKMDGENSSIYSDYMHARSVDGRSHKSRNWLKNFWSKIAHDIPSGWRICGENMYAEHSIRYDCLESYFYGFSVWNDGNICLSWDETLEWFELLGIKPVRVLYRGIWDEDKIRGLYSDSDWDRMEGYVVRIADEFGYGDFRKSVAKFVRRAHVQTVKHWMHGQRIRPNGLLDK